MINNIDYEKMQKAYKKYLVDLGFYDSVFFENPNFSTAIVGFTDEGNVVYDYDLMLGFLFETEDMEPIDAADFIGYNTMRALPYFPDPKPIIVNLIDDAIIEDYYNEEESKP